MKRCFINRFTWGVLFLLGIGSYRVNAGEPEMVLPPAASSPWILSSGVRPTGQSELAFQYWAAMRQPELVLGENAPARAAARPLASTQAGQPARHPGPSHLAPDRLGSLGTHFGRYPQYHDLSRTRSSLKPRFDNLRDYTNYFRYSAVNR